MPFDYLAALNPEPYRPGLCDEFKFDSAIGLPSNITFTAVVSGFIEGFFRLCKVVNTGLVQLWRFTIMPDRSARKHGENIMSNSIDDDLEEHMRRFLKPDGYCLQCRRPANQYHPIGPITITISDPDGDDILTHEFCEWPCFAKWAAVQAGGVFLDGQN
jgi:hypothetical protein